MVDLQKLLQERNSTDGDALWTLKETSYGGRGLFAVRDITAGEIIFRDYPSVVGPRSNDNLPGCSVCLMSGRPLIACSKRCGLPVCYGGQCEQLQAHQYDCNRLKNLYGNTELESGHWSPILYKHLALIRCLNLPQKEKEIIEQLYTNKGKECEIQVSQLKDSLPNGLSEQDESWLLHCCGVLDGTSFEIPHKKRGWTLRSIYPLSAMMNHSCIPNTRHNYGEGLDIENHVRPEMYITATVDIPKNSEITTIYCPRFWSTPTRRKFLFLTKHFLCNCNRCQDRTEFGTNLAALNCPCTKGILLPLDPLDMNSPWICNSCSANIDTKEILLMQEPMYDMGLKELYLSLPSTNYLVVQAKLNSIWKASTKIKSLSDDELSQNENSINDLVKITKQLRMGKARVTGILLMELYKTKLEATKRNNNNTIISEDLTNIWNEAKNILQEDLLAPKIRRQ